MAMIEARYFDGHSSRAVPVQLMLDGADLRIVGAEMLRTVPRGALVPMPARGAAPVRLGLPDGASCEIANGPAAQELLRALGTRPGLAERMAARPGRVLAVVVAFVVVVAAIYRWGIPLAVDELVAHAPPGLEAQLGAAVLRSLDEAGAFRPSTVAAARQQEVRARVRALALPPGLGAYRIEFRRFGTPNAFTLPGGIIVVGDELLAMADGNTDGLLTMLGHELGHVYFHDPARSLLHGALLSALAFWYLGDFSSTAAGAVGGVTALRYSRQAEHGADLFALHLMQANGIGTRGAAQLFRQLVAAAGGARAAAQAADAGRGDSGNAPLPEYLSTHPDIDDRIALFETGAEAAPAH